MTETDIEGVIAAQAALIAALDAGDVAAIEAATASLSRLLSAVRSSGAVTGVRHDRVDHALRQSDAARTRVNYLADRTPSKTRPFGRAAWRAAALDLQFCRAFRGFQRLMPVWHAPC